MDEVAGGSLWLQATPRWSQYAADQGEIDKAFEVLAPALPPGKPLPGWLSGPPMPGRPEEIVPYLLSIRDAAEFHAGAGK
jgi:hypothetical protein